jgi:hypothetical protein
MSDSYNKQDTSIITKNIPRYFNSPSPWAVSISSSYLEKEKDNASQFVIRANTNIN